MEIPKFTLTINRKPKIKGLLNIKCEKNQIGISDTSDLELQAVNQERQEWGRKAEFILGMCSELSDWLIK